MNKSKKKLLMKDLFKYKKIFKIKENAFVQNKGHQALDQNLVMSLKKESVLCMLLKLSHKCQHRINQIFKIFILSMLEKSSTIQIFDSQQC